MNHMTTNQFPRINAEAPQKVLAVACGRCGGSGVFHVFGTCFRCGGEGMDPTQRDWGFPVAWTDAQCQEWTDRREARNAASRQRSGEKAQEARLSVWNANLDRFPALRPIFEADTDELHHIALDIRSKAFKFELSEAQVNLVLKLQGEKAEKAAERAAEEELKTTVPVTSERIRLEGKLLSRKWVDTQFGSTLKGLLKVTQEDGSFFLVFGALASSIDPEVGDTIAFMARVEPSADDPSFGFWSRPTKAEILEG